jgi:hypothetical protein
MINIDQLFQLAALSVPGTLDLSICFVEEDTCLFQPCPLDIADVSLALSACNVQENSNIECLIQLDGQLIHRQKISVRAMFFVIEKLRLPIKANLDVALAIARQHSQPR